MKNLRQILEEFGDTIDPQGSADGDYDSAIKTLSQYVIKEKAEAIDDFADKHLTGKPLEQAIEYMAELKKGIK